jgi:hypothetical protein
MTFEQFRRSLTVALFVLFGLALGVGPALRAGAQTDCPDQSSCTGGSGSGSGSGGGEGGTGGTGTEEPPPPPTAEPSTPRPPRENPIVIDATSAPVKVAHPSRSTADGSVDNAVATPQDERLAAWATRFGTTPDEVKSWFGSSYSANDTIAGEGSGKTVHPDDEMTISDRSAVKNGSPLLDGANRVAIALHSAAVPLTTATTDTKGVFSATVRIPASTTAGRHFIVALAPNKKGGMAAFVFPLTVEARAAGPVFNGVATKPASGGHTPWLALEAVIGSLLVIALMVVRVRRASASGA